MPKMPVMISGGEGAGLPFAVLASLSVACALASAQADTITLTPVADAEIRQLIPDNNFGFNSDMVSGELGANSGFATRRALVEFALSGPLRTGAVINSVTVQVAAVLQLPSGAANGNFGLHRVLAQWSEGGVTWNSRLPGVPWQTPGAESAADAVFTPSSTVFVTGLGNYTFPSTPALVADVQAWVNDPSTNFGWMLLSEDAAPKTARHFGTRENPNPTDVPMLVIDFTAPSGPTVTLTVSSAGRTPPPGISITNKATVITHGTTVTNVEFFEGSNLLGTVAAAPSPNILTNVFTNVWIPHEERLYSVTAVATDDSGLSSTSARVNIKIQVPDSVRPTITLVSAPPNFARLTNNQVCLKGAAGDNHRLDHVEYYVDSGPFLGTLGGLFQVPSTTNWASRVPFVTSTNWAAVVPLVPGNNAVRVRSVDFAGNVSLEVTRFLTYVVTAPLTVTVQPQGAGSFTPNLNGSKLELGQIYSITARPGPNQIFAGWDGVANSNSVSLNFVMASNLVLVANFETNPFPVLAGTYTGLFLDTNNVSPQSSGSVSLQLGSLGSFSGKLAMNGASYSFNGQFDFQGKALLPVLRSTLAPTVLALQLDLTGLTGQITGLVTNVVGTNLLVSELLAERNGTSALAAQGGTRSFALLPAANPAGAVLGTGVAQASASGTVQIAGGLSDGRKFSFGSTLSKQGDAPFYLSLGSGKELMIGWLRFPKDNLSPVQGTLGWANPVPAGFSLLEVAPAPR